jgi:glycosyltransferase involved in cell wall biosynthesis
VNTGGDRLRLGVVLDAVLEGWTSMDYVGEMLVGTLRREHSDKITTVPIQPRVPHLFGRLSGHGSWLGQSADRLSARCVVYPLNLAFMRKRADVFHIVDHSYAHSAHVLPPERTGIYCHDLDALNPLLEKSSAIVPWRYALAWSIRRALQRVAIVFFSTEHVRQMILQHGLVDPVKLVRVPYGVAADFRESDLVDSEFERLLPQGRFVLHVGSSAPRKRLELLFRAFAEARAAEPDIVLIQQGANLTSGHRDLLARLRIDDAVVQFPRLSRLHLAHLYRRASFLALPSEREGFGLPLLEALACGTPVLASDIPAFREVGAKAATYCNSSIPSVWAALMLRALRETRSLPSREERLEQASLFSWSRHVETIVSAYRALT